MFGMRDVQELGCWGCRMLGCVIFGTRDVRDVGCSGYGMWDRRCLLGFRILI